MLRAQQNASNIASANLRGSGLSKGAYAANLGALMQKAAQSEGDIYAQSADFQQKKQGYADTLGENADNALRAIASQRTHLDQVRRGIDMQKRTAASGLIGGGLTNVLRSLNSQAVRDEKLKLFDYIKGLNNFTMNKAGGMGVGSGYPNGYFQELPANGTMSPVSDGQGFFTNAVSNMGSLLQLLGGYGTADTGTMGETQGSLGRYDIQSPNFQMLRNLGIGAPLASPEAAYGLNAQDLGIPYAPEFATKMLQESAGGPDYGKGGKMKPSKMSTPYYGDGGKVEANEEEEDTEESLQSKIALMTEKLEKIKGSKTPDSEKESETETTEGEGDEDEDMEMGEGDEDEDMEELS